MRRTRRRGTVLAMTVAAGAVLLVAPQVSGQPERVKEGGPKGGAPLGRFVLEVDGTRVSAAFNRLEALVAEVDVTEYMASSDKQVVARRLPAKRKPPSIALVREKKESMDLWHWHLAARRGDKEARRAATLTVQDTRGGTVARYRLEAAWPSSIAASTVKSGDAEVLMEQVTLQAESIESVAP